VDKRFDRCIVAAPGPSLTQEVAEACRGYPVIAVNDAYRRLPFADILYSGCRKWWRYHEGCPDFTGEKWSCHGIGTNDSNDNLHLADRYGVRLIAGRRKPSFSFERGFIHYGGNSGFQAVNLALLMADGPIIMVGFDMHGSHFFGEHPEPIRKAKRGYNGFIEKFRIAAQTLNGRRTIINATPGSALDCFPIMELGEALNA